MTASPTTVTMPGRGCEFGSVTTIFGVGAICGMV